MASKSIPLRAPGFLRSSIEASARKAYLHVRVDPSAYLRHMQRARMLPIQKWGDVFDLGPEILKPHADSVIRSSVKAAALEGMGLGLGGWMTVVPDLGILSVITMRLLQKLSLIYGFEYATDEDAVELWMAAASAAGLDLGKDFIEKQAIERLVPRIMDLVAAKMSAEIAEKWTARLIPLLSAGAGGALNYYFVRAWGRRAQKHFEARHRVVRAQKVLQARLTAGPMAPPLTQ